jgi:hypothetical protein
MTGNACRRFGFALVPAVWKIFQIGKSFTSAGQHLPIWKTFQAGGTSTKSK